MAFTGPPRRLYKRSGRGRLKELSRKHRKRSPTPTSFLVVSNNIVDQLHKEKAMQT
jgi:hypothetical protein